MKKVWEYWTKPEHITKWCFAVDNWHAPRAENDLRKGGIFSTRMEAKDGSFGFDFCGKYDEIKLHELIVYTMDDGRTVTVQFKKNGSATTVSEIFEAEARNPVEMQREGWQAILNNFKKYTE